MDLGLKLSLSTILASGVISPPALPGNVLTYGLENGNDAGTTADKYVDGTNGSDGNDGNTVNTAYATIDAAISALELTGGTIAIRDGIYRENLSPYHDGYTSMAGNWTIKGYGTERPRISGFKDISGGWTQCTISDQADVGSNYASIYKKTIAAGSRWQDENGNYIDPRGQYVREGGTVLKMCQKRDSTPYQVWSVWGGQITGDSYGVDGVTSNVNRIIDTSVFSLYTGTQLVDRAFVTGFGVPNSNYVSSYISAYDSGTNEITFTSDLDGTSGSEDYILWNILPELETGSWGFIVDGSNNITYYVWPNDAANLTDDIEVSGERAVVQTNGFTGTLTLENLVLEGGSQVEISNGRNGFAIANFNLGTGSLPTTVTVDNCEMRWCSNGPYLQGANSSITNCYIHDIYGNSSGLGMWIDGSDATNGRSVSYNLVERTDFSGIRIYGAGQNDSLTVTAATQTNPVVVTYTGTDPENGNSILLASVGGMTEINGYHTVANVNTGAKTFELSGVDGTGYTAYTSGGTGTFKTPVSDYRVFYNKFVNCGSKSHSNLANFYLNCVDWLYYGNVHLSCIGYFTYQQSGPGVVAFNYFDNIQSSNRGLVEQLNTYNPDNSGKMFIYNNTIPNASTEHGSANEAWSWYVANNIVQTENWDTGSGGTVSLSKNQVSPNAQPAAFSDATNLEVTNAEIYNNHGSADYRLKVDGPGGYVGHNMSSLISSDLSVTWSGFDFNKDIDGRTITWSDAPTGCQNVNFNYEVAIDTLSPTNGAVDAALGGNLSVTFNQTVTAGTGLVTLRNVDTDSTVETFDVVSDAGTGAGQVSFSGSTMTINPTSDLSDGVTYAVRIASTAVNGLDVAFAGISDDTTWTFTAAAPAINFVDNQDTAYVVDIGSGAISQSEITIVIYGKFNTDVATSFGTIMQQGNSTSITRRNSDGSISGELTGAGGTALLFDTVSNTHGSANDTVAMMISYSSSNLASAQKAYIDNTDYTTTTGTGVNVRGADLEIWRAVDMQGGYVWVAAGYLDPATHWSSFFDGSNVPLGVTGAVGGLSPYFVMTGNAAAYNADSWDVDTNGRATTTNTFIDGS